MKGKCTFLGTGASAGIPMVGCSCSVCLSHDPHNKRLRPSVLLQQAGKRLLIDAGPDFRYQALSHNITHLDGVLLTHTHYDHVAGLDELRAFYLLHRTTLPVIASADTLSSLQKRYDYLFKEKSDGVNLTAQLKFELLEKEEGQGHFCDVPFSYMRYEQGGMRVNGYRFGNFAYISDIKNYSEAIFSAVKDVETLVLSALSFAPSRMHLTIDEAVAFGQRVGAKEVYFTHICHEVDHRIGNQKLPKGFQLAYDGLEIEYEC